MDVPNDLHRRAQLYERRLLQEDLSRRGADLRDLGGLEAEGFGDFAGVPRVEKARDHVVNVKGEPELGGTRRVVEGGREDGGGGGYGADVGG